MLDGKQYLAVAAAATRSSIQAGNSVFVFGCHSLDLDGATPHPRGGRFSLFASPVTSMRNRRF